MSPVSDFIPGKIILSGEYAMGLIGARGIAMPTSMGMTATFRPDKAQAGLRINWPKIDDAWKSYVAQVVAGCAAAAKQPFDGTLTIQNDLPLGKGMGSSTALVIAVCRALLGPDETVSRRIEDDVNPGHSGMDYAVIQANAPIVFGKDRPPEPLSIDIPLPNATLIDAGTPDQTTAELIAWLRPRTTDFDIATALHAIGQCTERLLLGESVFTVFPDHHKAQVALGVVPPDVQALIRSIEQSGGAAKVIGAGGRTGGAGMVLGVHEDPKYLEPLISTKYTKILHQRGFSTRVRHGDVP